MRPSGKAAVLFVATLYTAGCAHSDYWLSRQDRQSWRPIEDRRIAEAPQAPPPKILPDTFVAAARLFETQQNYSKALLMYDKAIATCAGFSRAYHRKGLLLSALGKYEGSAESLRLAVEFEPEDANMRNDYAFALMILNEWPSAERQLRVALQMDPDFDRAHINLGMTLCQMDRFQEGLHAFRKVLPNTDARYNLGLMLRGKHRYQEAAESFETVLAMDPDFTAASIQLAQLEPKLRIEADVVTDEYFAQLQEEEPPADEPQVGTVDESSPQQFAQQPKRAMLNQPDRDQTPFEILANEWACVEAMQAAAYGFSDEPFFDENNQQVLACDADPYPLYGYAVNYSSNEGWDESFFYAVSELEPTTMAATVVSEEEKVDFSEADPPQDAESFGEDWLEFLRRQIESEADVPDQEPCEDETQTTDDNQAEEAGPPAEEDSTLPDFPQARTTVNNGTVAAVVATPDVTVAEVELPVETLITDMPVLGTITANQAVAVAETQPKPATELERIAIELSEVRNERRCFEMAAFDRELEADQAKVVLGEVDAWWESTVAVASPADDFSTLVPLESISERVDEPVNERVAQADTPATMSPIMRSTTPVRMTVPMPTRNQPSAIEPYYTPLALVRDGLVDWDLLEFGPPLELRHVARTTMAATVLHESEKKASHRERKSDKQSCDEDGDRMPVFPILGSRHHDRPAR